MGRLIRFALAAALILTLLSLLVVDPVPTSKVSWEYRLGFPLQFLMIGRYTGPCFQSGDCSRLHLESFDAGSFILELVLFAAVGGLAYEAAQVIWNRRAGQIEGATKKNGMKHG